MILEFFNARKLSITWLACPVLHTIVLQVLPQLCEAHKHVTIGVVFLRALRLALVHLIGVFTGNLTALLLKTAAVATEVRLSEPLETPEYLGMSDRLKIQLWIISAAGTAHSLVSWWWWICSTFSVVLFEVGSHQSLFLLLQFDLARQANDGLALDAGPQIEGDLVADCALKKAAEFGWGVLLVTIFVHLGLS